MYTSTGVPMTNVIKRNTFSRPDYMLERRSENWSTRRTFYYGLIKYSLAFGAAGAFYLTDSNYFKDDLNSRPDLQPMRIMCEQSMPLKERKVFVDLYQGKYYGFNRGQGNYFGKQLTNNAEHSWFRKLLKWFYPYYEYNVDGYNYSIFHDINKDYHSADYSNHYHFE